LAIVSVTRPGPAARREHAIDAPDRYDPDRFVIIGLPSRTRVLFVVHAVRGGRIRIISARRASRAQRMIYEEER
jgi:uncharacterized DUF497 family protein